MKDERSECTNMRKVRTTRILMARVRDVTSEAGIREFHAAWFLLDRL